MLVEVSVCFYSEVLGPHFFSAQWPSSGLWGSEWIQIDPGRSLSVSLVADCSTGFIFVYWWFESSCDLIFDDQTVSCVRWTGRLSCGGPGCQVSAPTPHLHSITSTCDGGDGGAQCWEWRLRLEVCVCVGGGGSQLWGLREGIKWRAGAWSGAEVVWENLVPLESWAAAAGIPAVSPISRHLLNLTPPLWAAHPGQEPQPGPALRPWSGPGAFYRRDDVGSVSWRLGLLKHSSCTCGTWGCGNVCSCE